jgi:hypothetical protein
MALGRGGLTLQELQLRKTLQTECRPNLAFVVPMASDGVLQHFRFTCPQKVAVGREVHEKRQLA